MFNAKGQEGAPFELLIAVFIMGFVIFAGLNAMNMLNDQKCRGTIDAKLEEFKSTLETTVHQKSPTNINFRLSDCFSENEEHVEISDNADPSTCADYCGSPMNLCTLLEYSNTGSAGFSLRKCLSIPPDTVFPSQSFVGAKCPDRDGYELQDLDSSMPQGKYSFWNKTLATDTFPTICAYKRKD